MSEPKLATIHIDPPLAEVDVWTVTIEPDGSGNDGAWFEHATAAEAFTHAVKWLTDRGLRWTCRIDVYAAADRGQAGEER